MKKGLQIITALVIIMAVLLAGAVAYTSTAQVWNKVTESGTKINPFAEIMNLLTGKKAFSIRVDSSQYTINKIDVVGESGAVLKSIENSNVIEFAIKPDKRYSINFYIEDPLGNELTIQSQSFSTGKDKGKTVLLSGEFNRDVFVFSEAKVYLTGLKSVGGTVLKFPKIMEYSPEPFSPDFLACESAKIQSLKIETGFSCPEWDQGPDKVGFCAIGRIDAGFCFPNSYQTTRASGGIMLNIDNNIYVCNQKLFKVTSERKSIPEEFRELCGESPPSGDVIGVISREINTKLLYTSTSDTILQFPIKINTYSKIFINEEADGSEMCLDAERRSTEVSFRRGNCKINFYYYKVCPPGYKYDRSTSEGGCVKLADF